MLITDSPRISTIKSEQSLSPVDCLFHYDVLDKKFKFIEGDNCGDPKPVEEIGAGVTIAAFIQMVIEYLKGKDSSELICIDYGRKIFDSLLYKADGTPSNVKALRFYFGMRPNNHGVNQLSPIIIPLNDTLSESAELKSLGDEQKAGDDVGHGITAQQFDANENGLKTKMVLFDMVKEKQQE